MSQGTGKLNRYDPKNPRFRKAYIRDRLADIKHERESLCLEREEIDTALQAAVRTVESASAPYANDNPRFRKAYIRDRMELLKEEREALVAERDLIADELAPQTDKRPARGIPYAGDDMSSELDRSVDVRSDAKLSTARLQ